MIHACCIPMDDTSSTAQNYKDNQRPNMKRSGSTASDGGIGRRERLRRLRLEIGGGHVQIPDTWGQETRLKDWADCAAFTVAYVPDGLEPARAALAEEATRQSATLINPVGES